MINTYLSTFVTSWVAKANKYKDGKRDGAFDRFFSLFVPFNALYQAAVDRMISNDAIRESDVTDRRSATEYVITYIGAPLLQEHLHANCKEEIELIVKLIDEGTFYVSTCRKTGKPDHQADSIHTEGIKSNNSNHYCKGILELIYQTRCNMFHGSKEFTHIQIRLLKPMNAILNQIVKILLARLDNKV